MLKSEFSMSDLGQLSYFLGIFVTHSPHSMFLCQKKYAEEIIHMPIWITANLLLLLLTQTQNSPFVDPSLYRSLAGALQYLTFTRSDIAYAVQQICLFMHDPRGPHFTALKRIIRYVKGTSDLGLHLFPSKANRLVAYTNAEWGGCPDTRRSTSGYCVFFGDNLVSWATKRQTTLSRSNAEAEYRGVANVVAETFWLRNLLLELHCPIQRATLVYCDVSAVYLGKPFSP